MHIMHACIFCKHANHACMETMHASLSQAKGCDLVTFGKKIGKKYGIELNILACGDFFYHLTNYGIEI